MSEDNKNITLNTNISFSIKTIIGVFVTIFSLLWGFYGLIEKRIESSQEVNVRLIERIEKDIAELKVMAQENKGKTDVDVENNRKSIDDLRLRFRDLQNLETTTNNNSVNTSGGSSSGVSAVVNDSIVNLHPLN